MFGRNKILVNQSSITRANVVAVLMDAYKQHVSNSTEIDRLYKYYRGNQPILYREKEIRPEINNKIVENRANEIVSFKTGYLCGEPIQYVSRGSTDAVTDGISKLNDYMVLCGKSARDKEVAEWMYIAGQAYRMVLPNKVFTDGVVPKLLGKNKEVPKDEAPVDVFTLDPRYAFVVYSSELGEPPLMGVKYVEDDQHRKVFSVYTKNEYYEIVDSSVVRQDKHALNYIPIIEYPLNNSRLGAFEIVIPILNAINQVQSDRINGIEQFIQSLAVAVNCEFPEGTTANTIRQAGMIVLKSIGENKAEFKILCEQLSQRETQTLVDYMYQTVLNIVGMPNRNGGSSTSDTGAATIVRDGWAAAEARAKDDELMFKEAERQFLKVVLRILRDTVGTELSLADIEVRFTRRNYENILAKSQVLLNMLSNDKIAPILAFTSCGMFSDPEDAAKMSAKHFESVRADLVGAMPKARGADALA